MSPAADDSCHADSAGVPWEGRRFEQNPHSGDDGSADPALLAALTAFRAGEGDAVAVVDAYRTARLLIPLVAEKGDEGVGPTGLRVDKTQELSIVTVAGPDGRRVLPVFTSVVTMAAWDPKARPVPADGIRTALAAASDDTDLIVIDPGSATEFVLRRPAVWRSGRSTRGSRPTPRRRCSPASRRASAASSPCSTSRSRRATPVRGCAGPS